MKQKMALFSLFIFLFIASIPTVTLGSAIVIDERSALGYQYTITKEQDTFTWEIGHQDKASIFIETEDNTNELFSFRTAVNDIQMNLFSLVLSSFYLFFVVMLTVFFLLMKKKKIDKNFIAIITTFAMVALWFLVMNSFALTSSLQDAKLYYFILVENL